MLGNLVKIAVRKVLDPGAIIQDLGHDLARCTATLQLQHDAVCIRVNCNQINPPAEGRLDLPSDDCERDVCSEN